MRKAIRKVFLEDLPKFRFGEGQADGVIDWMMSKGYSVRFIYNDIEGWLKIIDYNPSTQSLELEYLSRYYNIKTSGLIKVSLGNILGVYTKEFKLEIGHVFKDDNRDLIITNREYRRDNSDKNWKWYKYTCNVCGWTEGWIQESNLLNHKKGCSCCCGRTVVENINSIVAKEETQWMIPYFQGGYDEAKLYTKWGGGNTNNKDGKIHPICPDCGRIKNKSIRIAYIYIYNSMSCTCSDKISYPNKFSYSLLDQLNKIYKFDYLEHEYSPDWIGRKSYDNYFIHKGKEYILEMDGEFHFKDNNISGQTKEESKSIDDYKDKMAVDNNIEVVRIDCCYGNSNRFEYIKNNIIHSNIAKLFDLSKINWLGCESFALSNLVKMACKYKRDNPEMTTTEIGIIMKLDRNTIIRHLKKGDKLGWCNYCSKEEQLKASSKSGKSSGKEVEIFKDDMSLGVFPSCAELERKSEDIFGTKLCNGTISRVCNNKKPQYKGFTFKYINEIEQAI